MLKTRFTTPTNMSPLEIATHNLLEADKNLSLKMVIVTSMGWMRAKKEKENLTIDFQTLERFLRDNRCQTYLIAKKSDHQPKHPITKTTDNINYEILYSCRPAPYAMDELLSHWGSYEENFTALATTGIVCLSDTKTMEKTDSIQIFSEEERTDMELVEENRRLIDFEEIPPETFIAELVKEIKNVFGREPDTPLYSILSNGNPVFALTIDDRIVSRYGFSVDSQKSNSNISVVTL